ncbi:MAG: hypothetical protein ACR2MP_15655, partial [Streptosporangiaceae bacterium]
MSVPPDVVGTGVLGTGLDVLGAGEVGAGVVGAGVVGVGVGVGLVDGGGESLGVPGVDEGAGAAGEDGAGRVEDLDGCGVAPACATTALPAPVPAFRVAASGLCRGRTVAGEL